ncbi:MAG: hypothetical protein ACKVS8_14520 [Phycisphaerales bacterium]
MPDFTGAIMCRLDERELFVSSRRRVWMKVARLTGMALGCAAVVGVAAIQTQRWTDSWRAEQERTLGPLVATTASRAQESIASVAEIGTPGQSWVVAVLPTTLPVEASPPEGKPLAVAGGTATTRPAAWTWEPAVRAAAQLPQSAAANSLVDGYLRRRDRAGPGSDWAANTNLRFIRALSLTEIPASGAANWSGSAFTPAENPR